MRVSLSSTFHLFSCSWAQFWNPEPLSRSYSSSGSILIVVVVGRSRSASLRKTMLILNPGPCREILDKFMRTCFPPKPANWTP